MLVVVEVCGGGGGGVVRVFGLGGGLWSLGERERDESRQTERDVSTGEGYCLIEEEETS